MLNARAGLALYLYSGIPVVSLEGEWDEAKDTLLTETVNRLARAGHNEIIVNFSRATRLPASERGWMERLEGLAASLHAHYGRLDIVGTVEQVEACLRRQVRSLLRWATSEEEALSHIKGVPVPASGPRLTTHLRQN
jgi:hypothetical protein